MTDQNTAQAVELAPLIERVHGENHPELPRVRELTLALPDADHPRQAELFKELRNVTQNYAVPDDACEAFTGTYQALERADREHVTRAGAGTESRP